MSPLQKNSDGIRKAGPAGPIHLSRQQARQEHPKSLQREEVERETADERREEARKEATFIHEPFAPRTASRSWGRKGAYAGIVAVVLVFGLLTTVFARLTVTVKPTVEETEIVHVGALFDTSVSKVLHEQKVIPAEMLNFSRTVTRDFQATGRARVEERARGTAIVYNAFNSSPQLLVAGTRFTGNAGAIYRIQKAVTVPPAKIEQGKVVPQGITVELVADVAGDAGNIGGPLTLKIPGFQGGPRYEGFYAKADNGFSGGFRGDAEVVTAADLKRAEEEVSKQTFGELEADMGRKTPAGLQTFKELREIEMVKIQAPKVGSRAVGPFSVSAEAKGTALAFRETDVADLLASFTLAGRKDHEFIAGSARLTYTVRKVDFDKGKAEVTVGGDLKIKAKISERELAGLIAGKKESMAAELFKARSELSSFRMSFFPPWRSTAPSDPAKITFRVESP